MSNCNPKKNTLINFLTTLLIIAALAAIVAGCKHTDADIPDTSGIKIDLKTSRFDIDLYALDTAHLPEGLQKLKTKYPDFLDYYLDTIRAFGINGNYADTTIGIREGLLPLLTYKDFVQLQNRIKKYYPPDNKDVDNALKDGFTFLKYYYPEAVIPKVIYVNMGLSNWPAFPLDVNTLCIGLDMFVGEDFPYYYVVGIPAYMGAHLRKSYIPVSAFSSLYRSVHPLRQDDKTLLDMMIQRGKEQYYLHKILPHTPDSVFFGHTAAEIEWCNENEALIYNFFIQQNLLYNKEIHTLQPYLFDGPTTPGIPASGKIQATPGNLGTWLGYRIVTAYMAQHPKATLKDLTEQPIDAAKFLEEARYRPK
jgi:hypothetical protein